MFNLIPSMLDSGIRDFIVSFLVDLEPEKYEDFDAFQSAIEREASLRVFNLNNVKLEMKD